MVFNKKDEFSFSTTSATLQYHSRSVLEKNDQARMVRVTKQQTYQEVLRGMDVWPTEKKKLVKLFPRAHFLETIRLVTTRAGVSLPRDYYQLFPLNPYNSVEFKAP